MLLCQDFNEQFEGYTQLTSIYLMLMFSCFVRISMSNLKDIHNAHFERIHMEGVALSGFQ